jgi:hypothetical protein
MTVRKGWLACQELPMALRLCGATLAILVLLSSSAGCGRKGPLKPLKQRSPAYTLDTSR